MMDENQSLNHQCHWRKLYEDEHLKRIEDQSSYIKFLRKLEAERDLRIEVESQILTLKERVEFLEQRNAQLEEELQARETAEKKRITFGLSAIQDLTHKSIIYQQQSAIADEILLTAIKDTSRSPTRLTQLVQPHKLSGDDSYEQLPPNLLKAPSDFGSRKQSDTFAKANPNPGAQKKGKDIKVGVINIQTKNSLALNQRSSIETAADSFNGGVATTGSVVTNNSNKHVRTKGGSVATSMQPSAFNATPNTGLSIEYRDNDPQFYNIEEPAASQNRLKVAQQRELKSQAIRKIKSGDNFDFAKVLSAQGTQQKIAPQHFQLQQQQSFDQQDSYSTKMNNPLLTQSLQDEAYQSFKRQDQQAPYQVHQEKEQIKKILKQHRKQNLGFSKFKIISINEEGTLERIKLKYDPIRVAQKEFFAKYKKEQQRQQQVQQQSRKEKHVAKSMQFSENELSGRPQLHQLQPSFMLGQESSYSKFQEERDEEGENEEDAIDCQEGNKTPVNNYSMRSKRAQVMFQNQEILMFQSPKNSKQQQLEIFNLLDDEDIPVQTHRVLEENFDDQMLLETPVHRIGGGSQCTEEESKEYDTFRMNQKKEYSTGQIKELQESIRNRSTNKKVSRRQPAGGKISASGSGPGNTSKPDKKNLESFRVGLGDSNVIKEEPYTMNYSDEEQDQFTEGKEKSSMSLGLANSTTEHEHRLIKNPTYTRITHASKQMAIPGPFRIGATMGGPGFGLGGIGGGIMGRNDNHHQMNPLMKSMPNLDFLKQKDKNATLPFDEFSGLNGPDGSSHLQHSSTFLDINSSKTFIQPIQTQKLQPFASPQTLRSNKLQQNFVDSPARVARTAKIFEEFFVIGVDKKDLTSADLDWSRSNKQFISPKTLYLYNREDLMQDDCERRRVVKDFCFPDGIEIQQIKKPGDAQRSLMHSKAQKILYSSKSVKEQCFVFTLNAQTDEAASDTSYLAQQQMMRDSAGYLETFPGGGSGDKYFNCLCVVFNELISSEQAKFSGLKGRDLEKSFKDSRVFSTKKAYCFMFANSHYQLHLDALSLIINALKLERLKLSQRLIQNEPTLTDQTTYADIMSMLDLPLISDEMLFILDKYFTLDLEEDCNGRGTIVLNISEEIGCIRYDLPTFNEMLFIDCNWFCPTLFSLFSVDNLLKLLSAVLLEKSLVFIGKQSLLSSAILGLNSLLYPFKWCLALVPILPHPLIEMLEAPLPILVGITKREYRDITLTQDEKDSKIWVFLETGDIVWNKDGVEVPKFTFDHLSEIEQEYQSFKRAYEFAYTLAGVDSDRSSNLSESMVESSQLYNGSEEMKINCRRICEIVRSSLKEHILNNIKRGSKGAAAFTTQSRSSYQSLLSDQNYVHDIGDLVVDFGRKQDREFLQQFICTQMFTTYIEENIKSISQFYTGGSSSNSNSAPLMQQQR